MPLLRRPPRKKKPTIEEEITSLPPSEVPSERLIGVDDTRVNDSTQLTAAVDPRNQPDGITVIHAEKTTNPKDVHKINNYYTPLTRESETFEINLPNGPVTPCTSSGVVTPRNTKATDETTNDGHLKNHKNIIIPERELLNEHVIPLWLEQLVRPKPSGPDPFPLRKPVKEKIILPKNDENFKMIDNSDAGDFFDDFFNVSRKDDFVLQLCALFPNAMQMKHNGVPDSEILNKMSGENFHDGNSKNIVDQMVISKCNYQKMTELIINQIEQEIKNKSHKDHCQSNDNRLSTYDVNEMIPLPQHIKRLPPFLQVKLSLLATMRKVELDQVRTIQNSLQNSVQSSAQNSVQNSIRNSAQNSIQNSVHNSTQNTPTATPRNDDPMNQLSRNSILKSDSKSRDSSAKTVKSGERQSVHFSRENSTDFFESPMEKADVAADVAADVSFVSESTQNATYESSYKFEKTNNSMATNYKKSLISGSNDFMKNPLHKISAPTDMATKLNPPFEASFKLPTSTDSTVKSNLPTRSELFILYSLLTQNGKVISLRAHFTDTIPKTLKLISPNLVYLNLSFNYFSEISVDFFSNCRNLETLNLRNNPLKTLNLGKNMKKLKTLLVSFCLLEKVPENIETLTSITKIDFSYNKLTELPINLAKLQATLRDLDLSGNLIRALPAEYLKLSLKQFNFGQNLTAPCFWRESSVSQPKRLRDICLMSVLKEMNSEVPDDVKQQVQDSQYICGTCGRLGVGEKMKIIRPCRNLWGKSFVPFMFECCSIQGRRELMSKEAIEC